MSFAAVGTVAGGLIGGSATAAAIGGGIGSLVGGVAGLAGSHGASAPAPRNLGNELGNIPYQTPQQTSQNLNALAFGTPNWTAFAATPRGQELLANSNDYYGDNPQFADAASRFQDMYNNGYLNLSDLPTTGGVGNIGNTLNTSSRTSSLQDALNLGPQYANLLRSTNADYYNQLNSYRDAANAPITQSAAQQQQAQLASQGFNTPALSGMNSQFAAMQAANQGMNAPSWTTAVRGPNTPGLTVNPPTTGGGSPPVVSPPTGNPSVPPPPVGDPGVNPWGSPVQGPTSDQGQNQVSFLGNTATDKQGNPIATTNSGLTGAPVQGQTSDQGVNMLGNVSNGTTASAPQGSAYAGLYGGGYTPTGGLGLGYSNLQNGQNQIALGLLQQGGNLTPSELRQVQQNSRGAFASRGLDATNASVADEVLQTDTAQRNRLMQNLGLVQGIQGAGLAENQNMQNYGLNLNAQNLQAQSLQNTALNQAAALAEQQRQSRLNAMGQSAQLYQGGMIDPYAGIMSGTNQNSYGLLNNIYGTTTPSANSLLNYGSDLYNTNYNANAAANISNANNRAGLYSGFINAGSRIAGGLLGNGTFGSGGSGGNYDTSLNGAYNDMANSTIPYYCWVAREVYGKDNPEWVQFREAMFAKMSPEFIALYGEYGPDIAESIKDLPRVKAFIKGLMDEIKKEPVTA